MQQQQMSQEEMLQGAQAKMTQLDVLLHEALQEKMELKQSYGQLQANMQASMQELAKGVLEVRTYMSENIKDKAAAAKMCAVFDKFFGPYTPKNKEDGALKGAPDVDKSAVA